MGKCIVCNKELDSIQRKYCDIDCKDIYYMDKYGYPSELFIRLNARLCVCRSRSEKFNIPFSLVLEDIKNVIDKPCTYCGKTEKIQIDRKTPELGYVSSNIVPACSRCNRIKANDISHDDMIKLAEYLGWK